MNLYAYCLSDEVMGRMIESVPGIMGAAGPCLIHYGGIAVVASEFEGESVSATRENVFAHERVVHCVLAHTTPLPFRFGTVVSPAQLESYVNAQREFLMAQLAHVRGSVEMSVKVIWSVSAVRREALNDNANMGAPDQESEVALGRGAAFLAAKRREHLGDERLKARAGEVAAWLTGCLGDTVRESDVRVSPAEALVLAAAHLVERGRLAEYQERLRAARKERDDLHFLTSGPWPPYSFSQVNS